MSIEHTVPHDSAVKHVSGQSIYVDDIEVHDRLLVGRAFTSPLAHARIKAFDLSAARALPGVHAVLSAADIPGHNQVGPVVKDEPCLAESEVVFIGQAIFLIAADSEEVCLAAEKLIKIEFEELPAILTLDDAIASGALLAPEARMETGDALSALSKAPHRLQGRITTGAQEHWYLETQACLSVPGEGKEVVAYCSIPAIPCGPPKPRNAVFEGKFVLYTRPTTLKSGM